MSEILTTNEKVSKLEEKIDKVLSVLNPEKKVNEENSELVDKFDLFRAEMKEYVAGLKPTSEKEYQDEYSTSFDKRMWGYAGIGFIASALLTVVTYKFILFFFPLAFSLFFAYSLIVLGLLHDKYLLPGNTIRRIANDSLSASIFWLAFTIASVAGFAIGNSIISDPFGGEERGVKQEQVRYIENSTPSTSSDTVRLGKGDATED